MNYRTNLERFNASLFIAKKLLANNDISIEDYIKIEDKLASKYCIKISSIYRQDSLIKGSQRGNMCHGKEGDFIDGNREDCSIT